MVGIQCVVWTCVSAEVGDRQKGPWGSETLKKEWSQVEKRWGQTCERLGYALMEQ